MNKTSKKLLRGAAVAGWMAAACLVSAGDAQARGASAVAGTAAYGVDRDCFQEDYGGIRNTCSSEKVWVMPATYDNAGWMSVQVAAQGVAGTARRVRCEAWSVNHAGGAIRASGEKPTVRHDGRTELLKMGVHAHGWGGTYVYCRMDPGTLIRNFHY